MHFSGTSSANHLRKISIFLKINASKIIFQILFKKSVDLNGEKSCFTLSLKENLDVESGLFSRAIQQWSLSTASRPDFREQILYKMLVTYFANQ